MDYSNITNKINEFKHKTDTDSVSPEYVGLLLDEIVGLLKNSELEFPKPAIEAATMAAESAKFAADSARTARNEAQRAMPPVLELSEIDTMGTDGSLSAMVNFVFGMTAAGKAHTRYALIQSGLVTGILDVFSDNMRHVLTQVLETHYAFRNGELVTGTHYDSSIQRYRRSMNLRAPSGFEAEEGQWTKWQECVPESRPLLTVEPFYETVDPTTAGWTMFPASSEQLADTPGGTTPGNRSALDCVIYDSRAACFRHIKRSSDSDNNPVCWPVWQGCGDYGRQRNSNGVVPDPGRLYYCIKNNALYILSGGTFKKIGS